MRLIDATLDDVRKIVQSELDTHLDIQKTPTEKESWLSTEVLLSLLGVSRSTLSRYRSSGKLRFTKVGSRIWYQREDVDAFLKSGFQESGLEVQP